MTVVRTDAPVETPVPPVLPKGTRVDRRILEDGRGVGRRIRKGKDSYLNLQPPVLVRKKG